MQVEQKDKQFLWTIFFSIVNYFVKKYATKHGGEKAQKKIEKLKKTTEEM